MRAGHLGVPLERDVAPGLAADAQRLQLRPELDDALPSRAVEVEQERQPPPLDGDPFGHLGG